MSTKVNLNEVMPEKVKPVIIPDPKFNIIEDDKRKQKINGNGEHEKQVLKEEVKIEKQQLNS